jgi:ABC-2 type transport system ATP-binding protein
MLQRAGLAQALIADPQVLVLDEPMSGLDPMGRVLVRDIILEERRNGKTVFFSSHILSDIEVVCDRVAIVVGGKLRGQGTLAELVGHTVEWVDCVVEFSGELPGLTRREGTRQELRVPPNEVEAVLDQVRAGGGHILSVTPRTKTLEQVLLSEVERARPVEVRSMGVL